MLNEFRGKLRGRRFERPAERFRLGFVGEISGGVSADVGTLCAVAEAHLIDTKSERLKEQFTATTAARSWSGHLASHFECAYSRTRLEFGGLPPQSSRIGGRGWTLRSA
jgi:hypothetical protein